MIKKITLFAGLVMAAMLVQAAPKQDDYYKFTRVPLPEGVVLEAGGIAMLPDGKLVVSTRRGDIYSVSNPLGKAEVEEKAIELIEPVLGRSKADRLVALCDGLDDAQSIEPIIDLMRFDGDAARS